MFCVSSTAPTVFGDEVQSTSIIVVSGFTGETLVDSWSLRIFRRLSLSLILNGVIVDVVNVQCSAV